MLRANRLTVLYCTLLASAQSSDEKKAIEEKMREQPELLAILLALQRAESGDFKLEQELQQQQRKAATKGGQQSQETKVNGEHWNPQQVINLEDLVFAQGGHFMANKKCQLPEGSFRKQKKGYEEGK